MPEYFFDVEQGDDKWDYLRMGIPTSSNFHKILTPLGKPSKQWEAYAHHLIAERYCNRPINSYTSPAMENGKMIEQDAAEDYELEFNLETKKVGFVTTDDGQVGCSPDRLVGEDGLLEIKCPLPGTQIGYLLTGKIDQEYFPQLQGQLFVTGRQWVDIRGFNPELPRSTIRVKRDEAYIACLEEQLFQFNFYLRECMKKIAEMQPLRPEMKFYTPTEGAYNVQAQIQF